MKKYMEMVVCNMRGAVVMESSFGDDRAWRLWVLLYGDDECYCCVDQSYVQ